jgi:hypothetical protein
MLGRIFKILGILVALLVIAVGALFVGARFHDGPLALIPGGPLVSGELVAAPVSDWSFATAIPEIELQLAYEDSSRVTWILVNEGAAFIPASLSFPPGKRWHKAADQNGAAIVRIQGKRYPVTLKRVQDPALEDRLKQTVVGKYTNVPPNDAGVWFFALEPRADGA